MNLRGTHHLTYCTNIHAGESWPQVLHSLRAFVPKIKQQVAPDQPFGLGLRLSNQATLDLDQAALEEFKQWMSQEDVYVFTLNGFPYGGFHQQKVKDQVHYPDWTTTDRLSYTKRSFDILAQLLPPDLVGGISTSPLSYKPWHPPAQRNAVYEASTAHLLEILVHLMHWKQKGVYMHLDIEPEPDGFLEDTESTVHYYQQWLIPRAEQKLGEEFGMSAQQARAALLEHIQVCYDVCHFAVVYEKPEEVLRAFNKVGIKVGKIQISAALKKEFGADSLDLIKSAFKALDEPVYLHQVVAQRENGSLQRYSDLGEALKELPEQEFSQWRTHFHVPIFRDDFGTLQSTQSDIVEVLNHWSRHQWSQHLEVETYTWEVLPTDWQLDLVDSISRELRWVLTNLAHE